MKYFKFIQKLFIWSIIVVGVDQVNGAKKTWNKNTNFENPENWNALRRPCAGDTVIFPNNLRGAVFVNEASIGNEMVLPNNGELIFGKNSQLSFEQNDGSCAPKAISFVKTEWKDWSNPDNWNSSDFSTADLDSIINPVPHSDIIPCFHDDVIFPSQSSFRVKITQSYVAVKSLTFNGQGYQSQQFREFASSDYGSAQIKLSGRFDVTNRQCNDDTGCKCGNDRLEAMQEICSIVGLKCKQAQCKKPIKPVGFCCQICGAYATMRYNRGFKMNRLQDLTKTLLNKAKYKSCRGYLSKTDSGTIQFVITDSGTGKSANLAQQLKKYIEADNTYRLGSVEIYASGKWTPDSESPETESGSAVAGKVIGILFALLLIGALIVLGILMYRKRRNVNFGFVRFGTEDKIEMELEKSMDPARVGASRHAFHNPMYNLGGGSDKAKDTKPAADSKTEFQNPMFMELED